VSLNEFEMKATGLHNSLEYFIDSTSPVAFVFTLNSLSKSRDANTSLIVKIPLSLLNACYCSCSHYHFTSFFVNIFISLVNQAKSLMNLL